MECKTKQSPKEFYSNTQFADGIDARCRTCKNTRIKKWHEANPRKASEYARRGHLKHRYGIDDVEYDRQLAYQDGVCAICKGVCDIWDCLSVDHRETEDGGVHNRGLLWCNSGIRVTET